MVAGSPGLQAPMGDALDSCELYRMVSRGRSLWRRLSAKFIQAYAKLLSNSNFGFMPGLETSEETVHRISLSSEQQRIN